MKTSSSQVENQGVCSRRAMTKWSEKTISVHVGVWKEDDSYQCMSPSQGTRPHCTEHHWVFLTSGLSDVCLWEHVQEASLVCSSYEDVATSWETTWCISGIYLLLESGSQELGKLTGLKGSCFHQSVGSQMLHAWTAEPSRYKLRLSTNIHF